MKIRHRRRPRTYLDPRSITKRRLTAAAQAQQRVRDKYPLLPELWPNETPQQRLERFAAGYTEHERETRKRYTALWRKGRQALLALSPDLRAHILARWNTAYHPADALYFVEFLRSHATDAPPTKAAK
jgi:hypothetical protein